MLSKFWERNWLVIVTPNENTEIECAMLIMSLAAPACGAQYTVLFYKLKWLLTFRYKQIILSRSVFKLWLIVRVWPSEVNNTAIIAPLWHCFFHITGYGVVFGSCSCVWPGGPPSHNPGRVAGNGGTDWRGTYSWTHTWKITLPQVRLFVAQSLLSHF